MAGSLLKFVGATALFALGVLGVAALFVVKDRVRIVVSDDAARATDTTALLRDDLATVRRDLEALTGALGSNLEQLARSPESAATTRAAAAAQRLDRLEAGQLELRALAARVDQVVAELARSAATAAAIPTAMPTAIPTAATPAPVAASGPEGAGGAAAAAIGVPSDVAPDAVAPPTSPPEADPAAPAAPPAAERTSFLSFKLPSRSFQFAEPQAFEVVPELSRVGFDAKSTLHDFSGVTQNVRGTLSANLADPDGKWRGEIACAAGTLVTGVDGRDANMRENLGAKEHAEIGFVIDHFEPAAGGIDREHETVRGAVVGTMTIRGVARALTMPVELSVDASRRLVVAGQTTLRLPDYKVPVPSQLGVINMDPEVKIWIALRLRLAAGGAHGR